MWGVKQTERLRTGRSQSGQVSVIGWLTLPFSESQPYPGLIQEKSGQQVEGGDYAPLLCSRETPPGALRPALEPPT